MKRFSLITAGILLCCVLYAQDYYKEIETYEYNNLINSINKVQEPIVTDKYIVFTAETGPRFVGIAFDFENYQTIHPFKIKNSRDFNDEIISSIMFFSLERPADLTEISYRLVIDSLWTPDPVNANNYYDAETGVSLSKVEIGSTLPVVTGTNSESITRFIYNGESGKTVRIGGTFTNWDSWIYELEETSPGFYEISIPLPQGKYYYNYFLGMKAITDKTNPEKAYTDDGRISSVITVQ
ncbi:MAG: glycogen-binding domain-containing protein [Treponema sp.]|nr:glycogen-binding domain-containing protein [Treponema sp.]